MKEDSIFKNKAVVVGGIYALIAVAAILFFVILLILPPKGQVEVLSIPGKVTIKTNTGKTIDVNGQRPISLSPGKYTFDISAEGFSPTKRDVTIVADETFTIAFQLVPLTDAARKESEDRKYDSIREAITGDAAARGGEEVEKANPILKYLPIYDPFIGIEACSAYRSATVKANKIGICIKVGDATNKVDVDRAFSMLRDTGEPFEEYDIRINDIIYPNEAERAKGAKFAPSE